MAASRHRVLAVFTQFSHFANLLPPHTSSDSESSPSFLASFACSYPVAVPSGSIGGRLAGIVGPGVSFEPMQIILAGNRTIQSPSSIDTAPLEVLRCPVLQKGSSVAKVLAEGVPLASAVGLSFLFATKAPSAAVNFGGADLCLNLDGLVVNPPDGYGCTFGAGIGGSFKDCHCSGSSSGSGCSFDGVPSEDQKTNFQLLEFKVQQKLYAANSKMFYLNLREAVVEAEALANESNRTVIEQKTIQVNEGETILKQCIEDFEKRKAEEKKLDDLLLMVKGNNEVLLMLKKMLSSRKLTASVEAGNQKVDGADPPEKGKQAAQPTSERVTCRIYHYGKSRAIAYASSKGPVDHVVYILFKLFKGYSVCRKCYPVVFGSVAWYTSGIEWEEVWDLMEYHHLENKKKYKKIVTDYRVGKDKAAKAAAEAEAAKAAAEAEAAKADAEAEAPKADAEAEAAKADAEAEVADAAKPDEEAKASARKWYFLWLM